MKKILALSLLSLTALGQSKPLVSHMFTADPSAHLFQGQIYIYPSHDIDAGVKEDDLGSHFAMNDYHVLSQKTPANFIRFVTVRSFSKDYIFPVLLVFFNTVGMMKIPPKNQITRKNTSLSTDINKALPEKLLLTAMVDKRTIIKIAIRS